MRGTKAPDPPGLAALLTRPPYARVGRRGRNDIHSGIPRSRQPSEGLMLALADLVNPTERTGPPPARLLSRSPVPAADYRQMGYAERG